LSTSIVRHVVSEIPPIVAGSYEVRVEPVRGTEVVLVHVTPDAICPTCGNHCGVFVATGDLSNCVRCDYDASKLARVA